MEGDSQRQTNLLREYSYKDFQCFARRFGIPVYVVIQDYAALAVLLRLIKAGALEGLTFKGGTAIRRAYFPEARFSIDLDFETTEIISLEDIVKRYFPRIRELEGETIGSIYIEEVEPPIVTRKWVHINVYYVAPGLKFVTRVDIEPARRAGKSVVRRVITDPFEGAGGDIRVLNLEAIIEEKLESLVDRMDPKDLWDLFFLLCIKRVKVRVKPSEAVFKVIDLITERDWDALRIQYLPKEFRNYDLEEVKRCVRTSLNIESDTICNC